MSNCPRDKGLEYQPGPYLGAGLESGHDRETLLQHTGMAPPGCSKHHPKPDRSTQQSSRQGNTAPRIEEPIHEVNLTEISGSDDEADLDDEETIMVRTELEVTQPRISI
jgi:hypothetical protein